MAEKAKCLECKNEFAVKSHLKYRLQANPSFVKLVTDNMIFPWKHGFEEIYKAHLVICPSCGNEFSTPDCKYFGILKVKRLQVGLILFFLILIFAPLAVIFWRILE